ncbi:MAG: hypothetical protein ABIL09_17470 [Gemmatimonadota bacterium]
MKPPRKRDPVPGLVSQNPPVQAPEDAAPELEVRRGAEWMYWPPGKPLPGAYRKLRRGAPPPCPRCRRVALDSGSQAAACQSSGADFAHFRCRACGHTWKLRVEEVEP